MSIDEIKKQIRQAQRQVAKGKKSGFLDATHYEWQARLDQLNRDLFAAQRSQ